MDDKIQIISSYEFLLKYPGDYKNAINYSIYPSVNKYNDLFITKNKGTILYKYNWHTCLDTIKFHEQQVIPAGDELQRVSTSTKGSRFEQIWFSDTEERALDYYYNFSKSENEKIKILDNYNKSYTDKNRNPAIYKFILLNNTDILDLNKLSEILLFLSEIKLSDKLKFKFFSYSYRKKYIENLNIINKKLYFHSAFENDSDTPICKLIIQFVFGILTIQDQINFMQDLKYIYQICLDGILSEKEVADFTTSFPFTTFDGKQVYWIDDINSQLMKDFTDEELKSCCNRLSIMFFDMIALFSLFTGMFYSCKLLITGYEYPNIKSLWTDENNHEIAMINISNYSENKLFDCQGVVIDKTLRKYMSDHPDYPYTSFIDDQETTTIGGKKKYRTKKRKSKRSKKYKKTMIKYKKNKRSKRSRINKRTIKKK